MHTVRPAELELEKAAEWYDLQQPGLGDRFLAEYEHALKTVIAMPRGYSVKWPASGGTEKSVKL